MVKFFGNSAGKGIIAISTQRKAAQMGRFFCVCTMQKIVSTKNQALS